MLKLSIVTPSGTLYEGEVDYLVIDGNEGQMGILSNHVPVVVPVKEGFLKHVIKEVESYYFLSGAILEQNHNVVTVIAQEAVFGNTLEEAKNNFNDMRKKLKEENRQKLIDFTKLEKELAKSIKESKAGNL
jgi:F-type H+-transporting ATPase subunit epsilon